VYSSSEVLKFGIFPSTVSLNGTIFFLAAILFVFLTGDFVRLFGGSNLKPWLNVLDALASVYNFFDFFSNSFSLLVSLSFANYLSILLGDWDALLFKFLVAALGCLVGDKMAEAVLKSSFTGGTLGLSWRL